MLTAELRDICANILDVKGILLRQTVHEKYEKAFDMLILTQDELDKKGAEMKQRNRRKEIQQKAQEE